MSGSYEHICAAQAEVVRALQRLEEATGCAVESIDIHRIDVTTLDSTANAHMASVRINLHPKPGARWKRS